MVCPYPPLRFNPYRTQPIRTPLTHPAMPSKTAAQETIAYRLTDILRRFNEGEKLKPSLLAKEYGVDLRTIQRDLTERFAFLELEKSDGHYRVNTVRLGMLSMKEVARFAELAGLQGLHPTLSTALLKDLLDTSIQSALQIRGHTYEDLSGKEQQFSQLSQAIRQRHTISFRYKKSEGEKQVTSLHPYKLVNHDGIWYLAASDAGMVKSYTFTKISGLLVQAEQFTPDLAVLATLEGEDSIWLNHNKPEVVLKLAPFAADYFRRRKLIGGQKIVKELEGGGLLISGTMAHNDQIFPIVRQWLPHIHIISPEGLQAELEGQLKAYLATS